jgi:2-dehydropantoate 2-reductase
MKKYRYAIIGTGAIGGFYGAKLQQVGCDVHFLVHRQAEWEWIKSQGLRLESPLGDFRLPVVNTYNNIHQMPPCDVIIVALKTTQNYLLPELLSPLLNSNSIILLLQNGIGVEAQIADQFGELQILGGLCFVCSHKVGLGHIQHLDYGTIKLGAYHPNHQAAGITEAMKQIAADFNNTGIPIELSEDLWLARWQKLVWNIPYNGLSVVLNARTDEMMGNPETRLLVRRIMEEVVQGAQACGRSIKNSFIETMLDHTDNMKPYLTSMKLDYDAQCPLEIEAMFGNPLRFSQQAGTNLPRIEMLYQQLTFLDHKNRHFQD